MKHGDKLTKPFTTYHPGVPHCIVMDGDEPWLCFWHPDGHWVTEQRIDFLLRPPVPQERTKT